MRSDYYYDTQIDKFNNIFVCGEKNETKIKIHGGSYEHNNLIETLNETIFQ